MTLSTLEERGKIVFAVVGSALTIFYLIGLAVGIVFSARLGVPMFEVLHPYHILTGMWAVFPLVFVFILIEFAIFAKRKRNIWRAALASLLFIASACALVYGFLCLFKDTTARFGMDFYLSYSLITASLLIDVCLFYLIFGVRFKPLIIGINMVICCVSFSKAAYPSIPLQLGGAKPYTAELVPSDRSPLRDGPWFYSKGYSIHATILFETADNYYVDAPDDTIGPILPYEMSYMLKEPHKHIVAIQKRDIIAVRITYPDYTREFLGQHPPKK